MNKKEKKVDWIMENNFERVMSSGTVYYYKEDIPLKSWKELYEEEK